jgi:hypothetical protein
MGSGGMIRRVELFNRQLVGDQHVPLEKNGRN